MPITSNTDFVLYEGSAVKFDKDLVEVLCVIKIEKDDSISVDMEVWDNVDNLICYGSYPLKTNETAIESYTGTGSGEYSQFKNAVEQAVVDNLEAITENSGITFTIV